MHLYSGTTLDFVADATRNRIAEKLKGAFFDYFRFIPSPSEVSSWQNSLRAMSDAVQLATLEDHGIVVELQLPLSSKRLDCLLTGHDAGSRPQAVVVELKQWESVEPSPIEDCVSVFMAGRMRDVLHPSAQVGGYQRYLMDVHTTFSEGAVGMSACGFAHNARFDADAELWAEVHGALLDRWPLFAGDQVDGFADFLNGQLIGGYGRPGWRKYSRGDTDPTSACSSTPPE